MRQDGKPDTLNLVLMGTLMLITAGVLVVSSKAFSSIVETHRQIKRLTDAQIEALSAATEASYHQTAVFKELMQKKLDSENLEIKATSNGH